MSNENQDLINKTINTADLDSGGRLNPAQQDAFVKLVRDTSVLLSRVRFKQMPQSVYLIDKLYVGEPVTRSVNEDQDESPNNYKGRAVFGQIRLESHKLKSDWAISTETLQENIEGESFEDAMMTMMGKRISTDLELLAIQGDEAYAGGGPLAGLLPTLNGWDKLTDAGNVIDAGGKTLQTLGAEVFEQAINAMPEQYLQDPDLVWVMSRPIATNWQSYIAQRETAAGDDALRGNTLRPYGFPVLIVPGVPSRKAVTVTTAKAGQFVSPEFGPYEFTSSNNVLRLNVNGAGFVNVTIPVGSGAVALTAVELGAIVVAAIPALLAKDDGQGRLILETKGEGAAYSIVVDTVGNGSTANAELGINVAGDTFAGANTGSNVVNEGSFILLCNLKNLIFGMVDETRVYSEFNKDRDRIETVVYNQVAANIENLEALVKIANVRRAG